MPLATGQMFPEVSACFLRAGSSGGADPPGAWPTHYGRVPPQMSPSCHQLPTIATSSKPANMKLVRTLNPRATHRDTLVMRSSLGGDEDQGAEVATVVRDRRRRARCVPDRPVKAGDSRSLPDSPTYRLTWVWAGRPAAQTDLLSSGSQVRVLPGAQPQNPRSAPISL
jgi:hypothetical protein